MATGTWALRQGTEGPRGQAPLSWARGECDTVMPNAQAKAITCTQQIPRDELLGSPRKAQGQP